MFAAAIVVLIDHHATLRDLNLPVASAWRRWMANTNLAERLITNTSGESIGDVQILEDLNAMDRLNHQGQLSRAPGSSGLTEANGHAQADFSKYDVRTATSR